MSEYNEKQYSKWKFVVMLAILSFILFLAIFYFGILRAIFFVWKILLYIIGGAASIIGISYVLSKLFKNSNRDQRY